MKTVFLKNIHFLLMDAYYVNAPEEEKVNMGADLLSYLGLDIEKDAVYTENGYEFKIVDEVKYKAGQEKHNFLPQ
jgi:hypothetical protein